MVPWWFEALEKGKLRMNNRGFSLLQVLMVGAMMSFLALNMNRMALTQSQMTQKNKDDDGLRSLHYLVKQYTADQDSCTQSFSGQIVGSGTGLSIQSRNSSGTYDVKFSQGDQFGRDLKINSINLKHFTPATPNEEAGAFVVELEVEKISGSGTAYLGGSVVKKEIIIFGRTDSAGRLIECNGIEPDQVMALLRQACEPMNDFDSALGRCVPKTHTSSSLPVCDSTLLGAISYNTEEEVHYSCGSDGTWSEMLGAGDGNGDYVPNTWHTLSQMPEDWSTVGTIPSGPGPNAGFVTPIVREFTAPFDICGIRTILDSSVSYFNDSGFIMLIRNSDRNIVFTASRDIQRPCTINHLGSTIPVCRDENNNSCSTFEMPNFNPQLSYCLYPTTIGGGRPQLNTGNGTFTAAQGEQFTIISTHASNNSGSNYHKYAIEAKVCDN
jgi:hypothetical protein